MDAAELVLEPTADPRCVVALLRENGIVVVPGFLEPGMHEALLVEHRAIIERSHDKALPPDKNWIGSLEAGHSREPYPAVRGVFYSDWVREIARGYLGEGCFWNEVIYCTHERVPLEPITAPHFDTIQALKFFVYLTDTSERNGAFRFAPRSHAANAAAAAAWREAGGRVRDTPNVATEEEAAALRSIGGAAGTLLIFDSNGFHTGGNLQPGEERRVIRVQSYPRPRLHLWPPYFSRQWWRETRWNPLRRLQNVPTADRQATAGRFKVREHR